MNKYDRSCYDVCPIKFYATTDAQNQKICEKCHTSCKECFGMELYQCRSCDLPLNFAVINPNVDQRCVSECPKNKDEIQTYLQPNNNNICLTTCPEKFFGPKQPSTEF